MKKLLVLAMVLSMTTMAYASLEISIDGDKEAEAATITVVPSGSVALDIWTNSAISTGNGEGYFALAATMTGGTISGGQLADPTWWTILFYDDAAGNGIGLPTGDNGIFGYIATPPATVFPAGSTLINAIDFHCEGPGDVLVSLYSIDLDTGALTGVLDTVVIHQIPEPMTIGLLGLGGLFLRRRK